MGIFRRSKPLHERLAQEGGMVERKPGPLFTGVIAETGIHGVPREREYDVVADRTWAQTARSRTTATRASPLRTATSVAS